MNRCPECGGVAKHIITDITGRSYYQCGTGLTTFDIDEGVLSRSSRIRPCDTIIDDKGRKFTGTIAYVTDNRVKTLAVTAGKERR